MGSPNSVNRVRGGHRNLSRRNHALLLDTPLYLILNQWFGQNCTFAVHVMSRHLTKSNPLELQEKKIAPPLNRTQFEIPRQINKDRSLIISILKKGNTLILDIQKGSNYIIFRTYLKKIYSLKIVILA